MSDLIDAAVRGNLEKVKRLVVKGADLNAVDTYGNTPLHWAAGNGYAAVVEYLVAKGASVNAVNRTGNTPLHWAAVNGHVAVVEHLVANGADLNAVDKYGSTPLHRAAEREHPAIVEFLKQPKTVQLNSGDRREAALALIAEDGTLRRRLGIKPDLEFAPEFDVERLIRFSIKKRESADPTLEADVEAGIEFHLMAAKMLDGKAEYGDPMRP